MEKSTLYNLLQKGIIQAWRKDAEKDTNECFEQQKHELEAKLLNELSESCKKTLLHYCLTVEDSMDYLHYNLHIKILNLGIQIGMELENAFLAYEDQQF